MSKILWIFNYLVCALNCLATQQVWKKSRLQFKPSEKSPPPKGMSKEKYVELLLKVRGCQIGKRKKECEIYWEYEIRCCNECFYKKTVK